MAYPASSSRRARRFRFLLRVTYHGRDWYFADGSVSIDSDTDASVQHIPGLSVERYTETFTLLSDSIDRQSVPVHVLFPFDVAEAVAAGFRLDTAEAELSAWVEGTTYERRRVLLVGRVMEPTYGANGEPVRFSVEAPPWLDPGTWPNLYRFSANDTPSSINDSQGTSYTLTPDARHQGRPVPLVVGNPGNHRREKRTPSASLGTVAANVDCVADTTPGAMTGVTVVGRTTGALKAPGLMVLCGHATQAGAYGAIDGNIDGGSTSAVNIYDENGRWVNTTVPYHATIGNRTCTVANFVDLVVGRSGGSTVTALNNDVAGSFDSLVDRCGFTFISAHTGFDTFYGLNDGRQAGPLRTVHDLLSLTLSDAAYAVDWPRLYSALERVPRFDVEGYVDERVRVWDFVSTELLPLLPISLRNGPKGLYAIAADLSQTVDHAIGTIRAGYDGDRVGGVQYERRLADMSGVIEIEAGDWRGQPADTVTIDASSTLYGRRTDLLRQSATASRALSAVQRADRAAATVVETIKAPWLAASPRVGSAALERASASTGAHYVAHQRLSLRSAQVRTITYDLAPEFVDLEVGDLLRLVDADLSIDGPAYLSTMELRDGRVRGTFSLYEPCLK